MKNIFLRDASIMIETDEKSYTDNFKRITLAFDYCIKFNLSLQITINKSFYLNNFKKFNSIISSKGKVIKKITIHLTAYYDDLFSEDIRTKSFVKILNKVVKKTPNIVGICVHPDHLNSWKYLRSLKNRQNYLAIEVTDYRAQYGNRIEHIKKILKQNKFLKLVIDTSHIKELQLKKMLTFENFFKNFSKFIVEAQLSDFGNFYKSKYINTTHSLLNLKKDNKVAKQISQIYNFNKDINLVIEGLIPFGKKTEPLLIEEIKYIKKIIYN
jgi:hypothetical protein